MKLVFVQGRAVEAPAVQRVGRRIELRIGGHGYHLSQTEAVDLADALVDAAEQRPKP